MRSMLKGALAIACVSLLAHAARAEESETHTYWKQFKEGSVNKDVWAALDGADPALCTAEINGSVVDLLWDEENSTIVLFVNGCEITDLVMDIDAQNRPVFHADWLSLSISRIRGFIDINDDGDIIIGWNQIGYESTRFQISEGELLVVAAAKCRCGGLGGTVYKTCADTDCDNPPVGCRRDGPVGSADTGYCEWKATSVIAPGNPGDPVVISN